MGCWSKTIGIVLKLQDTSIEIDGKRVLLRTLREGSVSGDLPRPAPRRLYSPENRFRALFDRYQGYSSKKGGSTGYDGYRKVKGSKLSALVDRNGLTLACTVSPANIHDSRLYEPTLEAFTIPDVQDHLRRCSLRCTGDSSVQPGTKNKEQYTR